MHRVLRPLFTLFVVLLLAGGALLVGAQLVALVLGRGEWLGTVSDAVGPPTFVAASIAGLLAFVMSYAPARHEAPVGAGAALDD
ncbi:hypothetical protein SAMN06264364_1439 [Quadrisphaera granulorum]|uniref:Uncharacterized protein n=1 Tax=Quadrisphaera granulorum TaxID=317664 RepID=A0A315ZNS9_9ACTN|nr:hypothetical protein [Quadrisphaera granulorum]PWJ46972.1 hypothetical protein BXY45_1439 [Quadrisphaera granulorum]SZE98968.1 hypothetical protein SAMN06264364_1439 [Quadrisphaera granulorum]